MIGVGKISTVVSDDANAFATALLRKSITGKTFYVDGTNGSDARDGSSWKKALKTITQAESLCTDAAGDVIFIKGSFDEAVTCDKSCVTFIGIGNNPKDCQWTKAGVAGGSWCLKIAANYVRVENIYFRPSNFIASGVPAGIYLSGANWATIKNCRFQGRTGSYKAIYSPTCDSDNVLIEGCEFMYMNTATHGAGIWLVEADGLSYSGWRIRNNYFNSCVTAIYMAGRACLLEGNHIMTNGVTAAGAIDAVCTLGITMRGVNNAASNGSNAIHGNYLGGAYSETLYKDAASDDWAGNFNIAGVTAANPAP